MDFLLKLCYFKEPFHYAFNCVTFLKDGRVLLIELMLFLGFLTETGFLEGSIWFMNKLSLETCVG